jgi:hypothetical protein
VSTFDDSNVHLCIAALRIVKVTDSGNLTGERADGERPTGGWLPYVRETAHSGVAAQRGSQCVTEESFMYRLCLTLQDSDDGVLSAICQLYD